MRRTRISVADKLLYEYFFFSDFCSGYHENHTKQSELINPYKGLAKRKATSTTDETMIQNLYTQFCVNFSTKQTNCKLLAGDFSPLTLRVSD